MKTTWITASVLALALAAGVARAQTCDASRAADRYEFSIAPPVTYALVTLRNPNTTLTNYTLTAQEVCAGPVLCNTWTVNSTSSMQTRGGVLRGTPYICSGAIAAKGSVYVELAPPGGDCFQRVEISYVTVSSNTATRALQADLVQQADGVTRDWANTRLVRNACR